MFTPLAQRRARSTPVPKAGFIRAWFPKLPASKAGTVPPPPQPPIAAAATLPPLPGNYIWALLALLAGVIGLQMLGAKLQEALVVVEALVAAIGFLVWRRGK